MARPSQLALAAALGSNTRGPSSPWGVALALAAALLACRARAGDRCVCAEDCTEGLLCVASSRVLASGECTPAVGEDATPGVCLPADEAAEDGDGGGPPEIFMDLGSKLDFDPGPPADPETEGSSGTAGPSSSGETTDPSSSSGASSGSTDASSGSTGTSSGSTGTSSSSTGVGT